MIPISELDLIKIGEIIKAHGYKGEIVINLSVKFESLKKTELLFLKIDGIKVPFFFSETPKSFKKSSVIVKFKNVNSDEEVKELLRCSVFINREKIALENISFTDTIVGYDVYNNKKFIGKVKNYLNIPSNPIIEIESKTNSEILIPLNNQFIVKKDVVKREIVFNLPEGLIDVNL